MRLRLHAFCLAMAAMPFVAHASERQPIAAQKGIELWQRYCMSYSRDYTDIVNFFKTFNEFEAVGENWFAARKVAFDVGFMLFEDSGRGPCTVVFVPSESTDEAATALERQIYALDANAFRNREGQFTFVLMATRFTVIPTYDAKENIVSLTLVRE
ncbi:MAG TPA: hypothetical protein PLI43_19070 [Albidovulum sp.]|uniref:hypothetical protein n=1 Tax=Albidovulum sp. TaxID=1872424 RepID=UPI002CD0C47C|nr:hypothetical protein [Albidovulum sp.]